MTTTLQLHSGDQLPSIGLGLWKIENSEVQSIVRDAIEIGYRHFDSACDYGNEVEAGAGLRQALDEQLCRREDLWITSKLWNTYHDQQHVRPACERSLQDLGLDYLDLYLVHFPISMRYVPFEERYPPGWFFDPEAAQPKMEFENSPLHETWAAMEQLLRDGLVKNIGICNVGTAQLRDLLTYAKIRPSVLQIEAHPYLTQNKLLRYCKEEDIAVTAFSPLGALSYVSIGMAKKTEYVIEESVVQTAATRTGKTAAQVLLRWGIQRGTAIIPKSSNRDRLKENLALFDFELSSEEMDRITALNRNRRFNDPADFGEAAFNTFCPIYD